MSHQITYVCDSCDVQFMTDEEMDMPPHWFAFQVAIADQNGIVPEKEREIFLNFCSQDCVVAYSKSKKLRERLCLVDKEEDDIDAE